MAVYERDRGLCIFCGKVAVDIMHYISRGNLGLGIEENLACGCRECHMRLDQSKHRNEMLKIFRSYLDELYPNFTERKYKK